MNNFEFESPAAKFLLSQIEMYLRGNFGSLNKNDFEVLIFTAYRMNKSVPDSNFELSRALRLTESKIKRLKYESDLKYNQVQADEYERDKFEQFNKLISRVNFKEDNNKLQFVVEDPSLRKFIDNILKKGQRFSDSSFNSEIVKLTIRDLEFLLKESPITRDEVKAIEERAKNELKKEITFLELLPLLLQGVSLAREAGTNMGMLLLTKGYNFAINKIRKLKN